MKQAAWAKLNADATADRSSYQYGLTWFPLDYRWIIEQVNIAIASGNPTTMNNLAAYLQFYNVQLSPNCPYSTPALSGAAQEQMVNETATSETTTTVTTSTDTRGILAISPGNWIAAVFSSFFNLDGVHPTVSVHFLNSSMNISIRPSSNGTNVGTITLPLFDPNHLIQTNDNSLYLIGNQASYHSFQGSGT
jgi:hypothetical protein